MSSTPYRGQSLTVAVPHAIDALLMGTEGTTLFSHKADYDRLRRTILAAGGGVANKAGVAALVKLAHYLVHFGFRSEAYYFYALALEHCRALNLGRCGAERSACLQIAKILAVGKLGNSDDSDVASAALFAFLVDEYGSDEARYWAAAT